MNLTVKNSYLILEQREGVIKDSSFDLAAVLTQYNQNVNLNITAIVIGGSEIRNLREIEKFGIRDVIHVRNENLVSYSPSVYKEVIVSLINRDKTANIFLVHSAFGQDLAPRLAGAMQMNIVTDCIALEFSDNQHLVTRYALGGKISEVIDISASPHIVTMRTNHYQIKEFPTDIVIETVDYPVSADNSETSGITITSSKKDVSEADIIVSGGRGMGSPDNFKLLHEIAETLHGAVGASRAVVDAGWISHDAQVGQTGKTVSPSLYIACGISGAIQHLAGMSTAKCIVAFNSDKNAPIFSIADYGIIGDVLEILPKFASEIKK